MLFRDGEAGFSELIADEQIGVEIDLPVVILVAEGADGEDGTERVKGEDFDFGGGVLFDIRDIGEGGFEHADGFFGFGGVGELGGKVDAAEGIFREVFNVGSEDDVVADISPDVVGCVDGGDKEADFLDGSGDAAGRDEVANLEGAEDDEEDAGGEVGEESAPGGADGESGGGDEGGDGGGVDAEVSDDAEGEGDVEDDSDGGAEVAEEGGIEVAGLEGFGYEVDDGADEPATDHPDGESGDELDEPGEDVLLEEGEHLVGVEVHGIFGVIRWDGGGSREGDSFHGFGTVLCGFSLLGRAKKGGQRI